MRSLFRAGLSLILSPLIVGCPSLETLPSQAPVVELKAETSHAPYLRFVPSTYSDARSWPLVVLCHGTWPYDTAPLQMREWAGFAENQGIIVVAPTLSGVRGDLPPPPDRQIALQREDEQLILEVVDTIKRQYKIAEHQVFLTGWSAGGYAILHTGLRHPEIFRALLIRQGSFEPRFMDIPEDRLDRWQAISIVYGQGDVLLRDQSVACIKWLRDHGMYVDALEIAGTHRRIDPELAWKYFKKVVKERLWVRITTSVPDPDALTTIKFRLDAVPPVARQRWYFGDGEESIEASPTHVYAKGGRYEVTVNVAMSNGKKYSRKRDISVGTP